MNGVRPREILEVLKALEEAAAAGKTSPPVLATAVSLDGSVYARAGAMALFAPSDRRLQETFRREVSAASREGRPRLICAQFADGDPILARGFAQPGKVEILLEPVDEPLREHMKGVRESLLRGEGIVCALELGEAEFGRRAICSPQHPAVRECYEARSPELLEISTEGRVRRTFLCPIPPIGKVLIVGSGGDAAALAQRLSELGFEVCACDPRPGRLRTPDWDRQAAVLIEGGWEEARSAVSPDEHTFVAVMTHSLKEDLKALKGALQSPANYVGVLASAPRARELLAALESDGVKPRPGVLHVPMGFDIGAETPEEIALGVAAEIFAARSGRRERRRVPRPEPQVSAAARARVPGLVLAAGRGKRFTAGNKLAVPVDGRPVLRHAVENALASRLNPVIVVLGFNAEAGLKALEGLRDPRLRVVFNPLWESGKASSIEVGLREVPPGAPGVVSLLGDMPRVAPWLIDRVIDEFELSGKLSFPVFPGPEGPQKGYPTAFPRGFFGEMRALTGDDTAMAAVREHWNEAVKIPLEDDSTQADIDTAEDLQLLLDAPAD